MAGWRSGGKLSLRLPICQVGMCQRWPTAIGIRVLADRCLIKYGPCNELLMHDLLRDMGREIVRQESVKEPGRRSRLWYKEDALEVLRDGTGTEAVEGLFLNFHEPNEVQVNSKAFENMKRLWLLHLNYVHLREGYEHISRKLLWLCWNGFPLKCLPSNLHMDNLVTLDLRYSSLKKAWNGTKILVKLKFLYLSNCCHLIETPDFSGLHNLEELLLNDCIRLVEVDESIRFLNKLVVLDMKNCKKLRKVPSSILMLKSLVRLDISGCSMLGKFSGLKGSPSKSQFSFLLPWIFKTKKVDSLSLSLPPVLGFSCLKDLRMENCNLSSLPNEVGNLISLETLDLGKNKLCTLPDSICNLTCLKKLYLSDCDVSHLPNEIGRLVTLKTLILEGNSLLTLPDSICNLTRLEELNLSKCDVSHLPGKIGQLISLERLDLRQNNLLTLPDSFCNLASLRYLDLEDCNLSHLPDRIGMLSSLVVLFLERNNVCSLPNSFSDLASLEKVFLSNCGSLQSLPELPVRLREMEASHCTLLESIPTEFNWQAGLYMSLEGCDMLAKNNFANNVLERIGQSLSENKKYREWPNASVYERIITISLPGDEVPNWFEYQCTGSKLSLVVPPLVTRTILGYSLCIVYRTHENRGSLDYPMMIIRNKNRGSLEYPMTIIRNKNRVSLDYPMTIFCNKPTEFILRTFITHQDQDQMILLYFPSDCERIHGGDELEIEIKQGRWFPGEYELEIEINQATLLTVKKCGINLIYEDNTEMPIKK